MKATVYIKKANTIIFFIYTRQVSRINRHTMMITRKLLYFGYSIYDAIRYRTRYSTIQSKVDGFT